MQTIDYMLWGNADGGNEELSTAVDDDAYEFVEFAFSIIVAVVEIMSAVCLFEL